ncbi:MAG TPA: hypothetical protein VKA26_03360 [Ignavibacteriaceae bacterium]|nr:hypothetical protein [Ignavibacteriaceae bacterium]
MKNLKKIFSVVLMIVLYSNFSSAQQKDYKVVQSFKTKYMQIENGIKDADSLAQLSLIEKQIDELVNSYSPNKDLLDKSLYPDDFNSSITKLRKEYSIRTGDFAHITTLETRVSELNQQIDDLNKKNSDLLIQVRDLTEQSKIDKNKISQLRKTINALRSSLRKRDELVMDMIDSLMPPDFRNKGALTNQEKQNVYSQAQKKDIFNNVQNAINENINFLKITSLKPDDIDSIKEKQYQFKKTWDSFGPKLKEIYAEKGKDLKNAQKIDSAFDDWHSAIYMEAWNSINEDFSNHGINLKNFSSGKEFTNVLKNYTLDEIKNAEVKENTSADDYKTFADSAWFGNIKPNWVPYLIDNNMMTEAQKDTVEAYIAKWKDVAYPGSVNWLYPVIGLFVILLIALLVRKGTKKKPDPLNSGEAKP